VVLFAAAERFVDFLVSGFAFGAACEAEGCRLVAFLPEAWAGSSGFKAHEAAAYRDFTLTCLSFFRWACSLCPDVA
jgi:hypothetical protein